jgi:hypothetical protein
MARAAKLTIVLFPGADGIWAHQNKEGKECASIEKYAIDASLSYLLLPHHSIIFRTLDCQRVDGPLPPLDDEALLRRSLAVAKRVHAHGNHPFGAILISPTGDVFVT